MTERQCVTSILKCHSSEIRGLRSTLCPRETLQNLLICRHRPGHSLGKNIKLHEMKNEKNYVGFLIHKI